MTTDDRCMPELHDDGKGFCLELFMENEEKGRSFGVHFDVRYPEVGLPNVDSDELDEFVTQTLINFGELVDPEFRIILQEYDEKQAKDEHIQD